MDLYRYINNTNQVLSVPGINIPPFGDYKGTETVPELDRLDGVLVTKLVNSREVINKVEYNSDNPVITKDPSGGIKVDTSNPQFGWQDMLAEVRVDREASANKPIFDIYMNTLKQYTFDVNDQMYVNFHIPHDYAMGTDIYIHGHWSHNSPVLPTGVIDYGFEITYCKGHNQDAFPPPIILIGQSSLAIPRYQHMISEFAVTNVGGTLGLLDTNNLEPDGIFIVRCFVSANTSNPLVKPFLHFVDMHYQSNNIATKNRFPNFYT